MTKTFETFEICSICNFGTFCDSALVGVGAQRVAPLALGDEQKGQDRAFRNCLFKALVKLWIWILSSLFSKNGPR